MRRLQPRERIAFLGKTGTGKSTRAKALCARLMKAGQRVVVFDPHDEYSQEGQASKEVTLGPLTQRIELGKLFDDEGVLDEPELALAVVPEGGPRNLANGVHELAELVRFTGHLVLVLDEVGLYSEYAEDTLNELATQARHDDVPLVFVAQRAVQIPKTARTQLSTLNSGRQDDPADLRALSDVAGAAFAERVAKLEAFQCVEWHDADWTRAARKESPQSINPERKSS